MTAVRAQEKAGDSEGSRSESSALLGVRLPLALLLLLAAALRAVAFKGYFGSDDGGYAKYARLLSLGELEIPPPEDLVEVHATRVGLYAPAALIFRLLGPSEAGLLLFPLLCSLASVVLAFAAGRQLLGARAGLLAGLLAAILPMDARAASTFMPDGPSALCAAAGFLLLRWGCRQDDRSRQVVAGLVAGGAFVAAWLIKESVAYLGPVVLLYLLWIAWTKRRLLTFAACAATCLTGVAAEGLTYRSVADDPLYRPHAIERSFDSTAVIWQQSSDWGRLFVDGRASTTAAEYWKTLLKRVIADGPSQILLDPVFGLIPLVALLGALYTAFHRRRELAFPAFWFVGIVLMFNFSSASLGTYRPLPLADRFLFLQLFPAVLLAAGFLDHLLPRSIRLAGNERERAFWGGLLLCVVLLISAARIGQFWLEGPGAPVVREMEDRLDPSTPFYTDERSLDIFNFFWGFETGPENRGFRELESVPPEPGDYLVVVPSRIESLKTWYGYEAPAQLDELIANSEPLGGGLFRIQEVPPESRLPAASASEAAPSDGP
ncbi:MAG: glycosyltransferase family 39 protein [Acidobacteriota bacterium]